MPNDYMIQHFKKYCSKDCERKKIFETPAKHEIYLVGAAICCLTCVHHNKTNHFIGRMPEQKVEEVTRLEKFKNRVKYVLKAIFVGD